MSSVSNVSLTVIQRPTQTPGENGYFLEPKNYFYDLAVDDALGSGGSFNQRFIEASHTNSTVFLWESGCQIDGTKNCSLACSDSQEARNMVWNTPDGMLTLHNCLLYPILATAALYGWLVQDPPGLLEQFSIQAREILSINPESSLKENEIAWPIVNDCLSSTCIRLYGIKALEECKLKDFFRDTDYACGPSDNLWHPTLVFRSKLCDMGYPFPNPDLSGPGVLISCLQQLVILMAMWLLLSFAPLLWRTTSACWNWAHTGTTASAYQSKSPFVGKLSAVLLIVLQEFHKTQVFLFLILQTVSLLALYDSAWLDAPTFYNYMANMSYLVLISAAGVYSVTMGLLVLRKSKGPLEWYTLVTSTVCLGVCTATWYQAALMPFNVDRLTQSSYDTEACGEVNPIRRCFPPDMDFSTDIDDYTSHQINNIIVYPWTSAGPLCVALLLFLEKALSKVTCRPFRSLPRQAKKGLYTFAILCAEGWLLWGITNIFMGIYRTWLDAYHFMDWTAGQMIGVAIYIPVVIEALYLFARDVEGNFSVRLPRNYKVVKIDASQPLEDLSCGPSSDVPPANDQQSSAAQSSYELLPNPPEGGQRVTQAHMWSPA